MSEHTDRILRDTEVGERTGMSRSTRWRLVKRNEFPSPVKLTGSTVGWRASEIEAWIRSRQPKRETANG